ncbi:hypothetical protein [Streptomyces decoyicus]|uniref:hypothetical protein n=1 Tax=Streptomyces decoyicus TaxID=249567 RepID=UPI002F90BF98
MNQPLTPDRLAEIREREQDATKGPWGTHYDGQGTYTVQSGCRLSLATGFTSDGDIATLHGNGQTFLDATFIARARRDVPALLAELDRVRAERDAFADRVDTLTTVAKGNKRHVQDMHADLQKANRERDEVHRAYADERGLRIKAEAERDGLTKRLHDAAMTKTWTNEDGKKFVFVEDIAPPLLGLDR